MSEGALSQIRRVAVGEENGSIYTAPASWTNPRGIEDVSASATRERLADNRQRTSRRAGTASHNGPKSWELGFKAPLHAATVTDLGSVIKNAAGASASGSSFTYNDTGSSESTIVKSAGTHDPLLLITTASGKEVRPVKSVSSNDATLAIRASANPSGAENPATYYTATPGATETTLAAQWDRDGETDVINYVGTGGVCDRLALEIDTDGRVALDVHLMGADWSQEDGSALDAPSALSGHFIGFAAEVALQDIGTPAALTQIDMNSLSVNLAPTWIARKAARANTSGGAIPGSAVTGWKRGVFFSEPITLTVTKAATAYQTAIDARTAYGFLVSWSQGGPGANVSDVRVALWVPRVIITAATPTDIDGIEGCQLTLEVEEEALSAPYLFPYCLAFFS
jgi:hypothetical protein